jgi:hypothetical protein
MLVAVGDVRPSGSGAPRTNRLSNLVSIPDGDRRSVATLVVWEPALIRNYSQIIIAWDIVTASAVDNRFPLPISALPLAKSGVVR